MKMKKNKIRVISAVVSAIMLASSASAFAKFDAYNDSDGFTLGHYEAEVNQEQRADTEKLYEQRPKNERQFENLSRGLVAVPGENGTLVSWRFLGTDSNSLTYNLYCSGEKLNDKPITTTNFFHTGASTNAEYTLKEVENGEETGVEYTTTAWDKNYIGFKVTEREGYNIDDGAVADLDGDGEYEILLRRVPSMDVNTRTSYPVIEAYKTDGTHMWTIDIGPNEINEVDINFLAYDMDGDGKAEVIMRSFEGTTDGKGNTTGDTNGDEITDYSKSESNLAIFKERQYIVSTPEFLSIYDGETGEETDRTDLKPSKEPLSDWSYRYSDTGRLTKRASHYLFGLAYLDGVTPSVVMVRGAWDNVRAAAWHIEDGKFKEDWVHNTENKDDVNSIWGACNHNLVTVDVDFDGKDEILSGPMAIDHDGSEMYAVKVYDNDGNAQKLAHGDAFDVAKTDPDFNGYMTWACHETSQLMANIEYHDARTGEVQWGYSKNKDTGRSRSADIDPTHKGFEVWGSTATIPANISGENIADTWNGFKFRKIDGTVDSDATIPMNFKVYWDGDLLSELLDGTTVSKYNWEDKSVDVLMTADDCASNSGTKAVPCISADLFGDWREEIVWKTADEKEIRIYSTSIPTSYKLNTLMHDSYYRASVAVQNNHYNQPPNLSYYLGAETTKVPMFEGYVIKDGKKITNPDLTGSHGTYDINAKTGALSVKLAVDCANAYVGNNIVQIDTENSDVTPIIVDDRTLVPVRFIVESLGMDVGYNDLTRTVTLSGNGYKVNMTLDKSEYTINDIPFEMDVPAQVVNDRTLIPLRVIAESIGKKVEWDADNRLIYIGSVQFYDKANAAKYAAALKNGKEEDQEIIETPVPTEEPDLLATADYTEYTDSNNVAWKMYINEDYEKYNIGDKLEWAGTKKPGELANIAVAQGTNGKVMHFEDSTKGNRNAIYNLPYKMNGTVRIELDWKVGECTGGQSYGELRFADSSKNTFFALKTQKGAELQYSANGGIANGLLETDWKDVGAGFNKDTVYNVVIEADFDKKVCNATISDGSKTAKITDMSFENATDFNAMEVLAVRVEKNFTWTTDIDNLKVGIKAN